MRIAQTESSLLTRFTIQFSMLLATILPCGCNNSPSPIDPSSSTRSDELANTDKAASTSQKFGDFSFEVPAGWTVVEPDRSKTKAMLVLGGGNGQQVLAMIKVDVGQPAAPTSRQLAEAFANSSGGTISETPIDLDGSAGTLATTPSNDLATPKNMLIVFRGQKAYLIMGAATQGIDLSNAISQITESWRWSDAGSE